MKKRILAAGLSALMALSMGAAALAADVTPSQTAPVSTGGPDDVADTAWYKTAVDYVVAYDLMDLSAGMGGKVSFEPERVLSRQEIADAIFRDATARDVESIGEDAGMAIREMVDYADIGQSFHPAVTFCFDTGIMTGDNEHRLNPGKPVNRQELAAVLTRYYRYLVKTDPEMSSGMAIKEFTDYDQLSEWAYESIRFCVATGMLKGNKDGSFNPYGTVTRAEMAQILYNLEQSFVEKQIPGLNLITK